MFVRKKTNRSGTISVVVVSKAHGQFTEVKKFGVATSEEEADELFRKAQLWLRTHDGQQEVIPCGTHSIWMVGGRYNFRYHIPRVVRQ